MTRVLSIAALVLATLVAVPMMMGSSVDAAPPTMHPGEPGEPGGHLSECPWIATIEIVSCSTGEVLSWRSKSVSSQSQCSAGIQDLQNHHLIDGECWGNSTCVEYRWCEE